MPVPKSKAKKPLYRRAAEVHAEEGKKSSDPTKVSTKPPTPSALSSVKPSRTIPVTAAGVHTRTAVAVPTNPDVCWFYHGVFDLFGIPHDAMQNEASMLNAIASRLGTGMAENLLRTIRALKNQETV